jgi:biopolymer transport protein ExbD
MPLVEARAARPVLIRITPLIDVVFILLIFFMLTTRLTPLGAVEVSSAAASRGSTGERLPVLHLQAPEGLRWNGEARTRSEVLTELERLRPATVVVSTDPRTPLTRFTQWQGLLAERGITGQWRRSEKGTTEARP